MQKRAFEQTGLVPRSIIRTFDRFRRQILPGAETSVLQEFRISRYQVLVSVKCLFILLVTPLLASYFAKSAIFLPLAKYVWNTQQNEIFLNSYQEDRAFLEMQEFEEKIFFESLITEKPLNVLGAEQGTSVFFTDQQQKKFFPLPGNLKQAQLNTDKSVFVGRSKLRHNEEEEKFPAFVTGAVQRGLQDNSSFNLEPAKKAGTSIFFNNFHEKSTPIEQKNLLSSDTSITSEDQFFASEAKDKEDTNARFLFQKQIQQKTVELALHYNEQSIEAISNLFSSFITIFTVYLLFIWMKPQIIILKSFLAESLYNLSDTTKSFLLILLTDLLVGFHSPRGWEVVIEILLRNFGFPENEDFILLFVATFPVLLDTVFKYWIFRYLNQISPSTVATYHNMIE